MKIRNINALAILLVAMFAIACSSGSSDNTNSTSSPGPHSGGGVAVTEYDGEWLQGCRAEDEEDEIDAATLYTVINLSISDDVITSDSYFYTDASCITPSSEQAQITSTVSLFYPGQTTETILGDARHVDTTIESVLFDGVAPTGQELQFMQDLGYFDTEYDLVLQSDSSLYFGDIGFFNDGTTAADRPIELELDSAFVRQ